MTQEDIRKDINLQVDYLDGNLSEKDNQMVEELIASDDRFESDIDNLLLLGVMSGKRLKMVVKEVEDSKKEFLSKLLSKTPLSPNQE